MFQVGQLYRRRSDIHGKYGGQQQGGISTPPDQPFIFLFTGTEGEAHGYEDGDADDGTFHYFGEGQVGDMAFVRGNKAILEHAQHGKSMLLFRTRGKGKRVRYAGEYGLSDWEYREAPDSKGTMRQAIVFKLVPIDADENLIEEVPPPLHQSLGQLRERAMAAATVSDTKIGPGRQRTYYQRTKAVRDYVLARADGVCENCEELAPFHRKDGSPYLEPHHIRRISDGGPDHPAYVAGICPNCHREIHHGLDGAEINHTLGEKITLKEEEEGLGPHFC